MTVEVSGLGQIAPGVEELIVAVLAQVADMERQRINEHTASGRELAKATLASTGKTHRGKESLGHPAKADAVAVKAWKKRRMSRSAPQLSTSSCQNRPSSATSPPEAAQTA